VSYAEWRLARYFFFIWFIGSGIVPLLTLNRDISTQASWFVDNVFIFTGLVGFFILGTYIDKIRLRKSILYLGLILSSVWTILGTYVLINRLGELYSQFFLNASSFSVMTASITLFIILTKFPKQKTKEKYPLGSRITKIISENTLPIYLFHLIILEVLQGGFLGIKISVTNLNPIIEIPFITIITLIISLAIIVPLKKSPYVKKLLG
jgi:surface polysaccharide O-acyltransferase-like enzyme